ncbi:MAG TPA: hypothetical protein VLV45_09930 [Gemmatimonadales bacterium]|nr:hypothetical protein [Gemmatimonadales bacterium]
MIVSVVLFAALASAPGPGAPARADELRVFLDLTDATGGVFQTALESELRSLGDVLIVKDLEGANYVLRVAVQCSATPCEKADQYLFVFEIARPLREGMVTLPLRLALAQHGVRMSAGDAAAVGDELYNDLSEYERPAPLRVERWSRKDYRSEIRDFVTRLDRECLEFDRLTLRAQAALAAHDSVNAAALWREETRARRNSDLCAEQVVGQ